MTRPDYTDIVVVLDRSGSMAGIKFDMEGGFNTFIAKQREIAGVCRVSLYQFDTVYEPVYQGIQVQEVPLLELVPRGGTALYDALAKTIVTTGERLAKMAEPDRPGKVVFIVITDGAENASEEHKGPDGAAYIKKLVDRKSVV